MRMKLLLHQEAGRGEHAHTAVRKLRLAPRAYLVVGLPVQQVEGVEVADRGESAREAIAELALLVSGYSSLLHRDRILEADLLLEADRSARGTRHREARRREGDRSSVESKHR